MGRFREFAAGGCAVVAISFTVLSASGLAAETPASAPAGQSRPTPRGDASAPSGGRAADARAAAAQGSRAEGGNDGAPGTGAAAGSGGSADMRGEPKNGRR